MSIWTIILAAGAGSRFGGPKALALWGDEPLLSRAISVAPVRENTVVVTGAHQERLGEALGGVLHVHNAHWPQGMGTSIAAGLAYLSGRDTEAALILPVDQPFVTKEHLEKLVRKAIDEQQCIFTLDGDTYGPPAAIPTHLFPRLIEKLSSNGLKSVVTVFGICEGPGLLRDIDTTDDLQRLRAKDRMA